jgi:diacylglycerol kinase (ATP)
MENHQKRSGNSLEKRIKSFGHAFRGIFNLVASQPNARIHLIAAILVIIAAIVLKISCFEWCLVVFAIGLVFSAEAFNTAIEHLTDLASPAYNENAGKVKDMAAAGVLIAAITAAILGLIIFIPHLVRFIR